MSVLCGRDSGGGDYLPLLRAGCSGVEAAAGASGATTGKEEGHSMGLLGARVAIFVRRRRPAVYGAGDAE